MGDIFWGVAGGIAGIALGSFALSASWIPFAVRVLPIALFLLAGVSLRHRTMGRRRLFGLGLALASALLLALLGALFVVAWAIAQLS